MQLSLRTIVVRGLRTEMLRGGAGAPLVYLHGGDPSIASMRSFLEPLAKRYEVFAPIHPGFGASDLPAGYDSVDDLVFHYLSLFDSFALEKVNLVGLTLGGWVAAEIAAWRPDIVAKLILVNAHGIKVDGIPLENPFVYSSEKLRELLASGAGTNAPPPPMTSETIAARLHDKEARFRFLFQRMYNPKLHARLARISAPTLVLWGEQERLLPVAYGQAYAGAISGARFLTLPGGHALPIERPTQFSAAVEAFLSQA